MTNDPFKEREKLLLQKQRLELKHFAAKRQLELERRKGAGFGEALVLRLGPDPLELQAAEMRERHR
jgi:hypothetical protein